jgi:hypothetical protein
MINNTSLYLLLVMEIMEGMAALVQVISPLLQENDNVVLK